jgi:hypothetical protein
MQSVGVKMLKDNLSAYVCAAEAQADARQLATDVLETIQLVELTRPALARALNPFPVPVRTPAAIHLATMVYLQGRGLTLELATYDTRHADAAISVGITLAMV